jgi:3-phosphoshikimate 1-carboxyvinyltransferase
MEQTVSTATRLSGTLELPADKSISHRAAMFAALADETSVIGGFSDAADPQSTLKCLRQLGVPIRHEDYKIIIRGVGRYGLKPPGQLLDCGNSGTTMRLLSGILGGAGIEATLVGDNSLSKRPMRRIIDPLRNMGIAIQAQDDNFAPLHISRKGPLKPIRFDLPIASAQLKSCVLLAGLFGDEPTEVIEHLPSRDHTERLLGLQVHDKGDERIIISDGSQPIPAQNYQVPGDFSAAAFWLVAGSIVPDSHIILKEVGINPTRSSALNILERMGASIRTEREHLAGAEPVADLVVDCHDLRATVIHPEEVPNCIDEIPVLAVAMAFAEGESRIEGAAELRFKESDRLKAVAEFLEAAGIQVMEKKDGLVIHGNGGAPVNAARFKSYDDHRIAMAAGILALRSDSPSIIDSAECVSISYPAFWNNLTNLTNSR